MASRSLPLLSGPAPATAGPQISPEWVRISMASAVALRFRSGRFSRDFEFGGINLLLNYDDGCLSDCGYCGLARTRPGTYADKSFIRVEWPLVRTDELVERMAKYESRLTRLCISMVTHGHAYRDTCDITGRIAEHVRTPLSILVAPPTLNRRRIEELKAFGVDMIGIGLDAVTEDLFRNFRTDVPAGGLKWDKYWEVVNDSRDVFGPWKVNVHTLVGLGETDEEIRSTMTDLRAASVDILTLGQYLRPTPNHLDVERYVTPEQFAQYRSWALEAGFLECVSGPLVRSSYRAEQALARNNAGLHDGQARAASERRG